MVMRRSRLPQKKLRNKGSQFLSRLPHFVVVVAELFQSEPLPKCTAQATMTSMNVHMLGDRKHVHNVASGRIIAML